MSNHTCVEAWGKHRKTQAECSACGKPATNFVLVTSALKFFDVCDGHLDMAFAAMPRFLAQCKIKQAFLEGKVEGNA